MQVEMCCNKCREVNCCIVASKKKNVTLQTNCGVALQEVQDIKMKLATMKEKKP
jgi:hypothetical protein